MPPTILVIFGISGDLAKRKLLPALTQIAGAGLLPAQFKILGLSRRSLTLDEIVSKDNDFLSQSTEIIKVDLDDPQAYLDLKTKLVVLEKTFGQKAQCLFYFSVPPEATRAIIAQLGAAGFSDLPQLKLLLEKPFGVDFNSAQTLVTEIKNHFKEEQIYRIDHYLAKEMVQNLVVFRSHNSLFRRTWNNQFIESIEIVATEQVDIEGRAHFYEQTGALRDIVQSHLLQLAALTLMELPSHDNLSLIPQKRLAALNQLISANSVPANLILGQYEGYQAEVNKVNSGVETFISLTLHSSDPRWTGVPITITAGKALKDKTTEIRVRYIKDTTEEADMLVLRIQPDEAIEILLWVKEPGYERQLKKLKLDFTYADHFGAIPEAYERVFVDALRGDHTLFTTSEEVLASWQILAPVQKYQQNNLQRLIYPKGASVEEVTKKTL
jgi:glucose-6-phosphate 1-dehydrogenase